jgi:hypothetical protein
VTNVERHFGVRPVGPLVESKIFNAARKTVTLLVEAGPDRAFWEIYRHNDCKVREHGQGGRAAVIRKLVEARSQADARFIAVVDADFDRLPGSKGIEDADDLVLTDGHDLETTLLGTPALEKIVRYSKGETNEADELRWNESTRSRLFRHGLGLGRLRWLKVRERIEELVFNKAGRGSGKGSVERFADYRECVDPDWSPSVPRVIRAVVNYSQAQRLASTRDLEGELNELPTANDKQICNGHDLLGLLGVYLADGNRSASDPEELNRRLSNAVERAWISQTDMWQKLRAWERANDGFRVLNDEA